VVAALQQATRTIPIVFANANNPIGFGFVASMARPGGNITGFVSTEPAMGGKWLRASLSSTTRRHIPASIFSPLSPLHSRWPSKLSRSHFATAQRSNVRSVILRVSQKAAFLFYQTSALYCIAT
jgi:hypothetical protein